MSPCLALAFTLVAAAAPAKPLLVTPEALKAARQVIILDARDGQKYESSHIPGAISLPWVDLAQMPVSPNIKDTAEAQALLTSKGIRSDRWVVVYGDALEGWGEEGRLLWSLQYLGHSHVSLLDGGLPAWKLKNLPITTEGPQMPTGTFKAAANPKLRATKAQVNEALADPKLALLDVRDADEFAGARKYNEARGGHVPKAINLPWKQLLGADGKVRPPAEVRKLLEEKGVGPERKVIVYCTGGVRSGLAYVALKVAGFKDVANYDGSFWEWSSDAALPVGKP